MNTCKIRVAAAALASLLVNFPAEAQSMKYSEVLAAGATALTASEVKEVVTNATTELVLVNGSTRIWTNKPDGTFIASRNNGAKNRSTGRGVWSINEDAAFCLTFDWGALETEEWCRKLYRVENSYYAFSLLAKPDTLSGRYQFSK